MPACASTPWLSPRLATKSPPRTSRPRPSALTATRPCGSCCSPSGRGRARGAQHPALERLEHGARAIAHAELGENARDVILDRALGRAEGCGDLAVAVPAGHEAHHLGFAHRERLARRF